MRAGEGLGRTTGPPAPATGPERIVYEGQEVARLLRVPIAFGFQGEEFEGEATFAPVAGQVHWFSTCR